MVDDGMVRRNFPGHGDEHGSIHTIAMPRRRGSGQGLVQDVVLPIRRPGSHLSTLMPPFRVPASIINRPQNQSHHCLWLLGSKGPPSRQTTDNPPSSAARMRAAAGSLPEPFLPQGLGVVAISQPSGLHLMARLGNERTSTPDSRAVPELDPA